MIDYTIPVCFESCQYTPHKYTLASIVHCSFMWFSSPYWQTPWHLPWQMGGHLHRNWTKSLVDYFKMGMRNAYQNKQFTFIVSTIHLRITWWRHQTETFSALLDICAVNSPVPSEFPTYRPVTRSFDVFFDLRLNKRLSKQSWGWWFETPSRSLWRPCNDNMEETFPLRSGYQ